MSLEPVKNQTWYFVHNNMGYCLNHFGRFAEAEPYADARSRLIRGDTTPSRNLGIALEGQGDYMEAAHCFISERFKWRREIRGR